MCIIITDDYKNLYSFCLSIALVATNNWIWIVILTWNWLLKVDKIFVRSFLVQRYERMSDTSAAAMREAEEEEREHAALMEYNRKENERLEALRKTRWVFGILTGLCWLIAISRISVVLIDRTRHDLCCAANFIFSRTNTLNFQIITSSYYSKFIQK